MDQLTDLSIAFCSALLFLTIPEVGSLMTKPVQEAETEPSGGILPLVFGLPFAPEISAFDFQTSPAKALVSQRGTPHTPSTNLRVVFS